MSRKICLPGRGTTSAMALRKRAGTARGLERLEQREKGKEG